MFNSCEHGQTFVSQIENEGIELTLNQKRVSEGAYQKCPSIKNDLSKHTLHVRTL